MKKLLFLFLMVILIGACSMQRNRITYKCNATLFLVCDNYPKDYKKTMGELSYTRNVLLVFNIKNLSSKDIILPISENNYSDTAVFVRVRGKGSADIPCAFYNKHSQKISFGDSMAIAIHLQLSDLEKIGIDLDEKPIEDYIPELQFECLQKENGETTPIITDIDFSPNILYKHGKLFIEYFNNGTKREIELYEDSNDFKIVMKNRDSFNHGDRFD